ncbi:MAG: hypothetical protein ACLFV8_13250 [Alphaproteobacteria bacterium]
MLIFRGRSRKDQIKLHHEAVAGLRRCLNELETLRQASGDADGSFSEIMRAGDRLVRQWGSLELRIRNGDKPGEARKAVILQYKATQGFLEQHRRMAAALEKRRGPANRR